MPAVLESRPTGSGLATMSWASVRTGMRRMPALYFSLLAASLLSAAASFYVRWHQNEIMRILGADPDSGILKVTFVILSGLAHLLVDSFIFTIAAVAMHRFILLGEVGSTALFPTSIYVRRFYGGLLAITVLAVAPIVAAAVLVRLLPSLYTLILPIAFFASVFIFIRSVMVLPATAIGDFRTGLLEQIEASWHQMDGQFWLFIRGGIWVAWPFFLLLFLFLMVVLLAPMTGITGWPDLTLPYKLLNDGLISFVISVLDVGLASWLYAWVRTKDGEVIS